MLEHAVEKFISCGGQILWPVSSCISVTGCVLQIQCCGKSTLFMTNVILLIGRVCNMYHQILKVVLHLFFSVSTETWLPEISY